jgi:hypothetical protein
MSLSGIGMLCTRMDMNLKDDAEFNRWYDKEHMEERVRIPGFMDARRYVAIKGKPKYLNLYDAKSLAALDSPVYRKKLAKQTDWSMKMMAKFENFHRTVGKIDVSVGFAHGAYVGFIWLQPAEGREKTLRTWIAKKFPGLIKTDDILCAHLLESDPKLSVPPPGAGGVSSKAKKANDWFVIVEGTDPAVVEKACRSVFPAKAFKEEGTAKHVSFGLYRMHGTYGARGSIG